MMKKILFFLLAFVFVACNKYETINKSEIVLDQTNVENGYNYVKINVDYHYPVSLKSVMMLLSEKENMSDCQQYQCIVNANSISIEINDLKDDTRYFYQFICDNGYEITKCKIDSFKTLSILFPSVTTNPITNITETTALGAGEVVDDGGCVIISKGICWSTSPNPQITDNCTDEGSGIGKFSSDIIGLSPNTKYYVNAYATNSKGKTGYGTFVSFTTNMDSTYVQVPIVNTNAALEITQTSAVCGGSIINEGNDVILKKGVCWSISSNPLITDNHTDDGTGDDDYISNLTGLSPNTKYYYRAYLKTDNNMTYYGNILTFITLEEENTINGHKYVDLGLPSGLKWASCNIGAKSVENYGDYFAWGELQPTNIYNQENCATFGEQMGDISGNVQFDAARYNWGASWRLPKQYEFQELINECNWIWTSENGVNGCKIIGPNGNFIFIPAAGFRNESSISNLGMYGYLWCSTPYDDSSDVSSYHLFFNGNGKSITLSERFYGRSIRPVSD